MDHGDVHRSFNGRDLLDAVDHLEAASHVAWVDPAWERLDLGRLVRGRPIGEGVEDSGFDCDRGPVDPLVRVGSTEQPVNGGGDRGFDSSAKTVLFTFAIAVPGGAP